MNEQEKLKVHSIFESISGEAGGFPQGTWVTFIRLQGCNLRCSWCDTKGSQEADHPAKMMTPDEIFDQIQTRDVLITGGEPLYQAKQLIPLIAKLLQNGRKVQIETNGSLKFPNQLIPVFYHGGGPIHWVVDYKCPSSGMSDAMPPLEHFFAWIRQAFWRDKIYLKWVIADDQDLEFALGKIEMIIPHTPPIYHLISPIDGKGEMIQDMVAKIRKRDPNLLNHITFSVQLHKLINMP